MRLGIHGRRSSLSGGCLFICVLILFYPAVAVFYWTIRGCWWAARALFWLCTGHYRRARRRVYRRA